MAKAKAKSKAKPKTKPKPKAAAKKETTKAVSAEVVEPAKPAAPLTGKETPIGLVEKARNAFGLMQRSWFEFATTVQRIREVGAYTKESLGEDGFDNFKEFCEAEYPSTDYNTILKLCTVAERFGDMIETRMKKDEQYQLPAYHSVYRVAVLKDEDVAKKEDLSKLRKAVLDNQISYHELVEQLKGLVKAKRRELNAEVETDVESLEKDLSKELADEDLEIPEEEFEGESIFEEDDDGEEIDEDDDSVGGMVTSLRGRVDYLIDNLESFTDGLTDKMKEDEAVIELASKAEKLGELIEAFLKEMEGDEENE